jgi:hypothetical protein
MDPLGIKFLADVAVGFMGWGCIWMVGHSSKNSPLWIDGPLALSGIGLLIFAGVNFVRLSL